MIEIHDCEQGTEAWRRLRAGRVTGSGAANVMAKPDTASYQDYLLKLAVERMTGIPQEDGFSSRHTRHGSEMEPLARVMVEMRHDLAILQCGFITPENRSDIGFSPDGYTGRVDRILEVKCPKSTTHVKYLKGGKLPAEYRWQVIHGMLVTGALHYLFASFDERMPEGLQLFTVCGSIEDVYSDYVQYHKRLAVFLGEVQDKVEELERLK